MLPNLAHAVSARDDRSESFAVDSGEPWKRARHYLRRSMQPKRGLPREATRPETLESALRVMLAEREVRLKLQTEVWPTLSQHAEDSFAAIFAESNFARLDSEFRKRVRPDANGEFVPSGELTSYWVRGLRDHIDEFSIPDRSKARWMDALKDPDAPKALAVRLKRLLAVIGNRQHYEIEPQRPLAERGRFSLTFQHHVLDRLPLRPDETTEFFNLLHEELFDFLEVGGVVGGAWGNLVLDRSSIRIQFAKKQVVNVVPEGWSRAKVLK